MAGSKPERLICYVTVEVKEGLEAIGRDIQPTKGGLGKAIRQLLQRAYANQDVDVRYFEGDETASCSVDATHEEIVELHAYQRYRKINEQRKGFKDALLRGYSIYLDEADAQAGGRRDRKKPPSRQHNSEA